jgi:hypothetical protein
VRRNQFDVEFLQLLIKRIRIVCFITDYSAPPIVAQNFSQTVLSTSGLRAAKQTLCRWRQEDQSGLPLPKAKCLCPAWFFPHRSPFLSGHESSVNKRFPINPTCLSPINLGLKSLTLA